MHKLHLKYSTSFKKAAAVSKARLGVIWSPLKADFSLLLDYQIIGSILRLSI